MKLVAGEYRKDNNDLEITIKSEDGIGDNNLKLATIKSLVMNSDLKIDFKEDYNEFEKFIEEVILTATDLEGYEHFYSIGTTEFEKTYNDYDELIISNKARVQYLEFIVDRLKSKYY
ncbi:hypothetical protein [Oceanobacillus sp. 1P07AA]|uniref:hypothetical protein n=1 Tax=Oceanobacillus sp. 1P07AA TaxID=3132293 RepID=UPI0039A6454D